jgi:hypothetical protein
MANPSSEKTPVQPASGISGWPPVWMKAVTKPRAEAFVEITQGPEATSRTAFIWVFLVGTLSTIVSGLLTAILRAAGFSGTQMIPGLEGLTGAGAEAGGTSIASLLVTVCVSPLAGVVAMIFFAIGVGIVQWVAKLFGGTGSFDKLAYAVAAISVPFSLVSMVLAPLSVVPYLGICSGLLSFVAGIYVLVLEIMAVKGVNRFGWGPAVGSVLLPSAVLFFVCLCVVLIAASVFGAGLSELMQQFGG